MNSFGELFVIAAPSGTGKTSLVRALSADLDHLEISISYTTRPPRPGEVNGIDYFFIDENEYDAMLSADQFLEHATIYGYHYGTSRKWVREKLDAGVDVILEIDWQGAAQIKQKMPEAAFIFILPPSLATLNERLLQRKQDTPDIISRRMAAAQEEISHFKEFNYLVVNENFQRALTELKYIIFAYRLSLVRQEIQLADLLAQLLKQ